MSKEEQLDLFVELCDQFNTLDAVLLLSIEIQKRNTTQRIA